jgi:hypothetical protein
MLVHCPSRPLLGLSNISYNLSFKTLNDAVADEADHAISRCKRSIYNLPQMDVRLPLSSGVADPPIVRAKQTFG